MSPYRVIVMGTPDFAVPALNAIHGAGHDIVAVYTRPPRAAGRGLAPRRSPVHERALALGLRVRTPSAFSDRTDRKEFAETQADVAVVAAYGLLLPASVLAAPHLGCFNIHASLLPRWRGAAPIQRAIMAGDETTGITIMRMDEGLDTGDICLAEPIAIAPDMSAGELHDRLAARGARLMVRALDALERGALACAPQDDEGAVYANKISKSEARIDWSRPAAAVHNHIRALSPWPGAWCELRAPRAAQRVKVLRTCIADGRAAAGTVLDERLTIACGEGAVRLLEVQRAGRGVMSAEQFLRGLDIAAGTRLG